jgi:signal transduction histidine kinase
MLRPAQVSEYRDLWHPMNSLPAGVRANRSPISWQFPSLHLLSASMSEFGWGLAMGWASSIVASSVLAAIGFFRMARLQERTRQAERLAELGTLTGGLAHEIKNPLSTVQLNLQLLREDLPADEPAHTRLSNRLATLQRETARLGDILGDFLRYAGKIELDPFPRDVNALLEELVDFFAPQAQMQRVRLRMRPSTGPLIAPVDERLLKQALLNLMINALQAMPQDGGEIILGARAEDEWVVIDVTDTAGGIPPEKLEKIFEAYYSTKSGGTGLGLAIARRIAQEHGGQIAVTSEMGKGSVFTIRLPMG